MGRTSVPRWMVAVLALAVLCAAGAISIAGPRLLVLPGAVGCVLAGAVLARAIGARRDRSNR